MARGDPGQRERRPGQSVRRGLEWRGSVPRSFGSRAGLSTRVYLLTRPYWAGPTRVPQSSGAVASAVSPVSAAPGPSACHVELIFLQKQVMVPLVGGQLLPFHPLPQSALCRACGPGGWALQPEGCGVSPSPGSTGPEGPQASVPNARPGSPSSRGAVALSVCGPHPPPPAATPARGRCLPAPALGRGLRALLPGWGAGGAHGQTPARGPPAVPG